MANGYRLNVLIMKGIVYDCDYDTPILVPEAPHMAVLIIRAILTIRTFHFLSC